MTAQFPRLYPILDTASLTARGCPLEDAARAVLDAGARILQIRHKGHWHRDLYAAAQRVRDACQAAGAQLIANDRADFALLLGAGLHIGQNDLPPPLARNLTGPDCLIGFSTHNATQLIAASQEPVDYLALGPVFPTGSKMKPDPTVGVGSLSRLRSLTARPLVAIGGITRENARAVLNAGADSIAVIGDLLPDPATPASIRQRVEQWLQLLQA
ncbi:MAG: thiamine phosphate synthase [Bryobacterales bacterium]|nr:thiamine phosphate synthase [Bryobacterales bacterium]